MPRASANLRGYGRCFLQIGDRIERRLRRVAMRRMSGARNDRHVDRTVALFLRDLDLPDRPILVIGALHDRTGTRI